MPAFSIDEVLANRGGRWLSSPNTDMFGVEEWSKKRIRQIQEANFAVSRTPMEFALVNSGLFNAFATVHESVDVIAMNAGLILTLNNLFLAMMAHPAILPKVGDSSVEEAVCYNVDSFNIDLTDSRRVLSTPVPNDAVRKDYALKLSWIARNFILEHEFCHIFNGHVDWLKNKCGLDAFDELEILGEASLGSLDRQTLEMDADCYAASHTLLAIFRADPSKALANPFMNSFPDAMYAMQFALYTLFRIFHNKPIDKIDRLLEKGNHPPAILRRFMMGATLASRIDHQGVIGRISAQEHNEISVRAMRGVEAAFLFLKGLEWDPKNAFSSERFPDGIIAACSDAANTLQDNWKRLRSELEPFKRGAQLAE